MGKQVEVPQIQTIERIVEVPYVQTVEKVVEVPQAGETVQGGQRAVTNQLETMRQVAPAEIVQVTEMGAPLPQEILPPQNVAEPIVAPAAPMPAPMPAPAMVAEPVYMAAPAAPVQTYAAPVQT